MTIKVKVNNLYNVLIIEINIEKQSSVKNLFLNVYAICG